MITNNIYIDTIIKFIAELSYNARPEYNFQSWKYAIMKIQYTPNSKKSEISLDIDCDITLGDRAYLRKYILNLEVKKLSISISV